MSDNGNLAVEMTGIRKDVIVYSSIIQLNNKSNQT